MLTFYNTNNYNYYFTDQFQKNVHHVSINIYFVSPMDLFIE